MSKSVHRILKKKIQRIQLQKNKFQQMFYILFNTVIYGKTMEKFSKRKKSILYPESQVSQRAIDKTVELHSKIGFVGLKSFKSFAVYSFGPKEVIFDTPLYLGFKILEMSKVFT